MQCSPDWFAFCTRSKEIELQRVGEKDTSDCGAKLS